MTKPIQRGKDMNMTTTCTLNLLTAALVGVLAMSGLATQARAQETGVQTSAPDQLDERALNRRAIEAVVWGMPAVNAQLMFDAAKKYGADFNQAVIWPGLLTWKNQTLTPNPSTIYIMAFYNTKDVGPMVLEIPPADQEDSITGSVDDAWQTALQDVGPAGVDKGKGGKYLILPPGYKEKVPDGYITLPSSIYSGFALLRSNLKTSSEADVAKAVRTASASSSIRCHRRAIPRRRSSLTRSTSCSTARSPTTSASSRRSIASCSASPGLTATGS